MQKKMAKGGQQHAIHQPMNEQNPPEELLFLKSKVLQRLQKHHHKTSLIYYSHGQFYFLILKLSSSLSYGVLSAFSVANHLIRPLTILPYSIFGFPQLNFVSFSVKDMYKFTVIIAFYFVNNCYPFYFQFFNKCFKVFNPVIYHKILC